MISAPPARLWSSSTDAREESLAWFSASPKVTPFSSGSPKEVSSTSVFEFCVEAASDSPAVSAIWLPYYTLVTFYYTFEVTFALFFYKRINIKFRTKGLISHRISLHSPEYNANHLCQHCLWCCLVYRALATHSKFSNYKHEHCIMLSCWYQIPMKQTQKLPVKSNIVAYSDNPEQRLPMYCSWDKFYKMELFANYKHNK